MTKNICTAVANLPQHLITSAIAHEALKTGDVSVLDHLPAEYLTAPNVLALVGQSKYSWSGFSLDSIPQSAQTYDVCFEAVKMKTKNFSHVPTHIVDEKIVALVIKDITSHIYLLPKIPQLIWDKEMLYSGLTRLNSSGRGYGRSGHSCEEIKLMQIFLAHAPKSLLNRVFYVGLFSTSLPTDIITKLIPQRYKQGDYYIKVAEKDLSKVPVERYTKKLFLIALHNRTVSTYDLFHKEQIKDKFLSLLDDILADTVVQKSPTSFKLLPKEFRTVTRLKLAIESLTEELRYNDRDIIGPDDINLLTPSICKACAKKDKYYPKFSANVWTPDFVTYCSKHGKSMNWFEQMPMELQTKDTAEAYFEEYSYHAKYIRPDLISEQMAIKLHRDSINGNSYRSGSDRKHEAIPAHYFSNFTNMTGLPDNFFGGETTLNGLRENRKNYSYCKVGDHYLGIYKRSDYNNAPMFIFMTRRTPGYIQPVKVFDKCIQTYHTTWLEKMIADFDLQFEKPIVTKELKLYQINLYYNIMHVEKHKGYDIYVNRLLGGVAGYTASTDGNIIHKNTIDEIKEYIDTK